MSEKIQLDMFRETSDGDVLQAELVALKESHNAVRKKCFAQMGQMMKLILSQQEELDFIKVKMGLSCILEKKDEAEKI